MAIGVKEGVRTPLTASHGFILESSFSKNIGPMSGIYSLLVQEMRKKNEEEKISDKDEAFLVAQEYANTGFLKIGFWIKDFKNGDDDAILWNLIDELDSKYEELFPEPISKLLKIVKASSLRSAKGSVFSCYPAGSSFKLPFAVFCDAIFAIF